MRTFLAAALIGAANALYEGLIQLDETNFDRMVLDDHDTMWVVTFYADWCPYAKALEHEVMVTSRNMMTAGFDIKFGVVNVADNLGLVHHFGVERSPTIEIFGADKSRPTRYGGTRTHEAMDEYFLTEAPYEGFDPRKQVGDRMVKTEYDVLALEEDIDDANESRIGQLNQRIQKAIEKEVHAFEQTKINLDRSFQAMIDEIINMRESSLDKELERHATTVLQLQDQYERKFDLYHRQNEYVVQALRNAYLVGLDVDQFLETTAEDEGMNYLSKFDADDYMKRIAYADPEQKYRAMMTKDDSHKHEAPMT
jgi:hypothetical protein